MTQRMEQGASVRLAGALLAVTPHTCAHPRTRDLQLARPGRHGHARQPHCHAGLARLVIDGRAPHVPRALGGTCGQGRRQISLSASVPPARTRHLSPAAPWPCAAAHGSGSISLPGPVAVTATVTQVCTPGPPPNNHTANQRDQTSAPPSPLPTPPVPWNPARRVGPGVPRRRPVRACPTAAPPRHEAARSTPPTTSSPAPSGSSHARPATRQSASAAP